MISSLDWPASVISGGNLDKDFADSQEPGGLLMEAEREGVVALVYARLLLADETAGSRRDKSRELVVRSFKAAALQGVLSSMLIESETRHLLSVMDQAAIPGLLLKGQAIAQWAYPDPSLRASGDIDVLVATRDAADQLAHRLCESGYELFQPSGDLVALEMMLRREVAPGVWVEIDLHCRVINSPLFSERFTFDELMAESIALPRLGANARGLGPAHAFIHACMHWAATLAVGAEIRLKWLYDIPAFAKVFTKTDWQHLQQLAVERGLAGVCLGMIEAAQATFGADFVAVPADLTTALREAARHESLDVTRLRDWRYMQLQAFLAQPTARLRARYLWQRLWPSRDYMAYLYGRQDLGYWGLIGIRIKTAFRRFLGLKVSG
ncbi:nucleotidyltransferase family protein [Candidatus Skiveiella danica]|jgi:hypothetical protein|uniref:nucleotidyltransferase family protein n=1 Tax=Candidatus Skiveiella danica TaxID=3386177 RepID=UPI0039B922A4